MIVSSVSFAVSKRFEKHSMDVKALADKGDVFTSNKDLNILQSIDSLNLIETNVESLTLENNLENLVELLSSKNQPIYPVLDEKSTLIGFIDFEKVRPIIFNSFQVKYTAIKDVLESPSTIIDFDESIESIMQKFESSQKAILPVIKYGKFYGFLSKIAILEAYRKKLKEIVIE